MTSIVLNDSQQRVVDIVNRGGNVFISGAGGFGKSFLVEQLKTPKSIVTAPTGAAALVVGGVTNHRAFNAPIGVISDKDVKRLTKANISVLKNVDRVFLDEISMVRCDMLEHIDRCLKYANENDLPFGGKQVIAVGDFYQIAAFVGHSEKSYYRRLYGNRVLAFEAKCWNFTTVELSEPMRNTFLEQVEILNDVRRGERIGRSVAKLNDYAKANMFENVTMLCNFNKDVDKQNEKRFKELESETFISTGVAKGSKAIIKRECRVPEKLEIKVGMRVMTVVNHEGGEYVNGSVGNIIDIEFVKDVEGLPQKGDILRVVVLLDSGDTVVVEKFNFDMIKYVNTKGTFKKSVVASLVQLPIIPAWALSVYKAQGATLDKAIIDLGEYSFANAMTYVAVSRVKDLNNIQFTRELSKSDIRVCSKVKQFYRGLEK